MKKNVVMTAAAVLMLAIAGARRALAQTPAPAQPPPGRPAARSAPRPFVTAGARVDLSIEEAVARARERTSTSASRASRRG